MVGKGSGKRVTFAPSGQTKKKLRNALNGVVPKIPCEALERRMLLSVSATTYAGPVFTTGTSWTYQITTAEGETATFTRTVGQQTTFNGHTVTEIDTTTGKATGRDYIALDAAGDIIEYGYDSTTTFGQTIDTYSPYSLIAPGKLSAGTPVEATDTDTTTDPSGQSDPSTVDDDNTFSLQSEDTLSVTVPYGTFDAYKIRETTVTTSTDDDGNETSDSGFVDAWCVAGIGQVKLEDNAGNVYALTSFTSDAEHLSFTQQPTDTDKGDAIDPISVSVKKTDGSVDTDATGSITMSLNSVTGTGKLSGTVTEQLVDGVATFKDLKVDAGGTYTLTAVDNATPPVVSDTSAKFDINVAGLTWTGAGDGVNWSDPKNWDQNVKPINGDSLIFAAGAPLTSNNDLTGLSIATIDIQGSGYTLTGNSISLTNKLVSETGNNTYKIDTALVGSPKIDDAAGDLTIDAVLSGQAVAFAGPGTVTLDQVNTYTGQTDLQSGVTVSDNVVTGGGGGAFGSGSGTVVVDGGGSPVTVTNSTGGENSIQNAVTLLGDISVVSPNKELNFLGAVTAKAAITVRLTTGLNGFFNLDRFGGDGPVTFVGPGKVQLGQVQNLNLIIGSAAEAVLSSDTAGTASIDVQSGGILSSGFGSSYAGSITLETGGLIKVFDTVDKNALGTGTLNLKGGTLQDVAASAGVTLGNAVSLNGNIALSTASSGFEFFGLMTANAASTVNLTTGLQGVFNLDRFGGNQPVTFQGPGKVQLGQVQDLNLIIGSAAEALFSANTAGTANIDVQSGGTLSSGFGSSYSGAITLETGGLIKLFDTVDKNALGTGTLNLKGGTLQDTAASAGVAIGNAVSLNGNIALSTASSGFGFSGLVTANTASTVSLTTGLNGFFNLDRFGGNQPVTFEGPGRVQLGQVQDLNIIVRSAAEALFSTNTTGTASIDVQSGGTLSSGFGSSYSGTITLETGGVLKDSDTADKNGFGTGTLNLNGGTLQDVAASLGVTLGNAISLNGNIAISTANSGFGFSGLVTANTASTVSISSSMFSLINVEQFGGSHPLIFEGLGRVQFGQVQVPDISIRSGVEALFGNTFGGAANFDVQSGGTLSSGFGSSYSGTITLETGGVLKDSDTADKNGFGTGMLALKGGTLEDAAGGNVTIGNFVEIDGNATLDSQGSRLKFAQTVNVLGSGIGTVLGTVVINGSLTGSGGLDLKGTAFDIAGSNPTFSGNITLESGVIEVVQNNALGTATLIANGAKPVTLQSASTVGDPILENPVDITTGTLIINGQFTFPNGLTVAPGAIAEIEGAGTQVIVSGPLSGGGKVLIDGGTFSATGDESRFTGTISDLNGKSIPTITVTDAGGVANGLPFPATVTLAGTSGTPTDSLDGVSPTVLYYVGNTATGTGKSTPPSAIGTYTVVATFAGSANYVSVTSDPVTFKITSQAPTKTTPTLTVTDAGGIATGSPFPATVTLVGTSGTASDSLDGVTPTVRYYVGSKVSGQGSTTPPSAVGAYTVVASFAGSENYNAIDSQPLTFVISLPVKLLPPTIDAPTKATVSENGSIAFTGTQILSVADADANGTAEQLTLTASHGILFLQSLAGLSVISGSNGTGAITVIGTIADLNAALNGLTYTPAANYAGADTFKLSIKDHDGQTASAPVAITVQTTTTANPLIVPKVRMSVSSLVVPGQNVTITLASHDLHRFSPNNRLTYTVSFGDGTTKMFVGKFDMSLTHAYQAVGNYTVSVTATDQTGHTSSVISKQVNVTGIVFERSPFNRHEKALFIGGTPGNDVIVIKDAGRNKIAVTVNNIPRGTFSTSGAIFVERDGGHDVITTDKDLRRRVFAV